MSRVETAGAQAVTGIELSDGGKCACADCGETVREGDRVGVLAARADEAAQFTATRVRCAACRRRELAHPRPGVHELIAFGRLAVVTDSTTQVAWLTLRDVTIPVADEPGA